MEELIPTEFYLSQNYPNPFRDETVIKYCLPLRANVKVTLLNDHGIKVKEISNDICEAGTHQILFKRGDLEDGSYNYQLRVSDLKSKNLQLYTETKKMFLLKY